VPNIDILTFVHEVIQLETSEGQFCVETGSTVDKMWWKSKQIGDKKVQFKTTDQK